MPTTPRPVPFLLCVATLGALLTLPAGAADWTQYRGNDRDGHAATEKLRAAWPETGPQELWRVNVGDLGYSSMAVADGRVHTLVSSAGTEMAVAHDAKTGQRLWKQIIDRDRPDGQGGGPRATPTVAGDSVYVLGALGKLAALDAESGTVRWKVDLVEEYGAKIPQWGISGSPLVLGDQLLVEVGGRRGHSVASFDTATGSLNWASGNESPGYSSPLAVTIAGTPQVLFFTAAGLVSIDADNGDRYWEIPWRTSYDVNAAMPVFVPPNGVFFSSAYDVGAAFFRIDKEGEDFVTREVWKSRGMRNHFNSSVLVDGKIYGFDNGTLKCIDAVSGEEHWGHRGLGKGSLIYADGQLIVFGEQGQLLIGKASPDGFEASAESRPFKARTWGQPALADGILYLRSQSEMVALAVGR